jgi:hypothetical protein
MWKARKVYVKDLEKTLNDLESEGYTIVSTVPATGYATFDIVIVAQKTDRAYKSPIQCDCDIFGPCNHCK